MLYFPARDTYAGFESMGFINNPSDAAWTHLVLAACLYSVQLYTDFAGYTYIAMGSAGLFGISLTDNFRSPFLSSSITELWRNWHITLSEWLKVHIFFPLGGSRKGTLRKYVNILIVFLVSGLWHGTGLTFILWGAVNGLYQIAEAATENTRSRIKSALHVRDNSPALSVCRRIRVFILFSFVFIFFRASSLSEAVVIISRIFSLKNPADCVSIFSYGVSAKAFIAVLAPTDNDTAL